VLVISIGLFFTATDPASAEYMPDRILISVDLPAPF
jgi:hypothetical protein